MIKPILEVKDLKVILNKQLILDNVSFELHPNETLAIIGPNGAGKTTLYRALLGLIPYQGKIQWQKGIKIGYVPQKLFIDPDLPLTVKEFFTLKNNYPDQNQIDNVLFLVGFENNNILKQKIGILSGGELQRILVAWALFDHPDVLLFDEPTAGIDISAENTIYSLLHKLQKKEKLTILVISHELQLVYKYANHVVCLNKEKVCYGQPKDVFANENLTKLFGKDIALYHHH